MNPRKREKAAAAAATEKVKKLLILKGHSSSQIVNDVLKDLSMLSKPYCKSLSRKNDILPFENFESLEFLSTKNECGLFALASHTKKRPNNLVLGRTYDGHILDMIEVGIDAYTSMKDFTGTKKGIGSKPLLVFQGAQWETDTLYKSIQNILIDVLRGYKPNKISMQGVDHVISATCIDSKIYLRAYHIGYAKSDSKVPTTVLHDMGPFLDLSVRRSQRASEDLWKVACKKDKTSKASKVKNVSQSTRGDKVGRIHMKKQNLDKMQVRRVTALRTRNPTSTSAATANATAVTSAATSEKAGGKKRPASSAGSSSKERKGSSKRSRSK